MTRLAWPLPDNCRRITQRFGENPDFYRRFGLAGHEGLDIACPIGTPVYAAHDGWCVPRWGEDYGDQIWLYGDGVMTLYAHLSQASVAPRERVKRGDQIGLSGDTGRWVTGPHLHIGVKIDGQRNPAYADWLDPEPSLRRQLMRPKTSLHWQSLRSWARRAMADWGPAWVKIMDPPENGIDPFPEVPYKDIRFHTDGWDEPYVARGEQGGREYIQRLLPNINRCPWATAVEVTNERECNSEPGMTNLCNFSIGAMRELSAHGKRGIILNWPEASPHNQDQPGTEHTVWKMTQFLPAVREAVAQGHILGRHCYWRPEVEGPLGPDHALGRLEWDVAWWANQDIDVDRLQVLVTEWGIDGGIAHKPPVQGWRDMVNQGLLTPAQYVAQITEGERRAQQLPWLLGLFLFNAGSQEKWLGYDHDEGIVRNIIVQMHAVQPPPVLSPEEIRNLAWNAVGVPYNPTHAFPQYAREHSLGAPLGNTFDQGAIRIQAFMGGVVFCPINQWDQTTHIPW